MNLVDYEVGRPVALPNALTIGDIKQKSRFTLRITDLNPLNEALDPVTARPCWKQDYALLHATSCE